MNNQSTALEGGASPRHARGGQELPTNRRGVGVQEHILHTHSAKTRVVRLFVRSFL